MSETRPPITAGPIERAFKILEKHIGQLRRGRMTAQASDRRR